MSVPTPTTRAGVQVLEGEVARAQWAGRTAWVITALLVLLAAVALGNGSPVGLLLGVLAVFSGLRSMRYGRDAKATRLAIDMARAEDPSLR